MKMIKKILGLLLLTLCMLSYAEALKDEYSYSKLTETFLNQDPLKANPGEYVELRFKIEKEGNKELKDIQYRLVEEYPFYFDNSDTPIKFLGDWLGSSDSKDYYLLKYKLKVDSNAVKGDYELKLIQKSSENNIEKEFKFTVTVDDNRLGIISIGKIITEPAKLISDYDEAIIKVEITNMGEGDIKQSIAILDIPQGFVETFGYSTRVNIGTIKAGESKTAVFYVDTLKGIDKGNHNAFINITYKEDNADNLKSNEKIKNVILPIEIKVFGRPEYVLEEINVSSLQPSKSGQIRFKLKNIGSKDSDSTSVQIFKDSSQPFDFSDKSSFIGKMAVMDSGDVVMNVDIDDNAVSKEYKLKLQIRSVVDKDVLIQDEYITVFVENKKSSPAQESTTFRFVVYAICIVVGFFVGKRYKYHKKNN